ncbi:MAG TPA: DNA helicase RecQ [Beijerinckia sp.]|jgi:ATP-dependent DNA helicase RecQ|nr:DNA helicase RecQ [Beijerinckia sp.]
MQKDMEAAKDALQNIFGFEDFRPGQREILEAAFASEDILAIMPTGSGKSLCYQLPALVRKGLTIVVSPLIALMRDQVQQLKQYGIAAAALNSSNSGQDNAMIEAGLLQGRYRLVYVAPERLVRSETISLLARAGANVLAIDEAHCVSQWGHDFRPEYLALAQIAQRIGEQAVGRLQLIAVTATADAPTRADIVKKLFPGEPRLFVRSFDRPNLRLAMQRKNKPLQQIRAMITRHAGESGIIYCASRKGTEKLAEMLSENGHYALPYHAGLTPEVRTANQDAFLRNDGVIIVATIAFGMGIDKPNARFVCHADLPGSIEAYYQEIGRAGRDGLPADTLTLFGESDIRLRERQIVDGDAPDERKRMDKRKLQALIALCETPRCRRQTLLAAFGEAAKPCGNCDICEGRWPLFNGAIAAQKLMSAILRTSGRFFSGHLANLLIGQATEAIKRHGHDVLPTFGVGKERTPAEWRSLFHQLHALELIEQDPQDRDRWIVTTAGRNVLTGKTALTLRGEMVLPNGRNANIRQSLQDIETAQAKDPKVEAAAFEPKHREAALASLTATQHRLLAALKSKRLELAKAQKQPAFVIFPDSVLIELARRTPRSLEELGAIQGVGPVKSHRYGAIFLGVIAEHGDF